MKCRKIFSLVLSLGFLSVVLGGYAFAQDRQRVVGNQTERNSEPAQPTPTRNPVSRPILTTPIRIVENKPQAQPPLVKKTVSSTPVNPPPANYASNQALALFNQRLMRAMQSRIGIPYHYGSDGPNSYDCSGLVWSVFQDAGLSFTRTSAASYFQTFEPVYGDERFKFGTLVFFNRLGHVGIMIDENTFFQASSSKGVTFSPLAGYWEKRVVGFRRIPMNAY
ncbi:MAG TPA: C40 family peptidase [Pyrinomonadaceae bacterium]|nr:C40 family peptidase [Pyrinomonadaceae bacterium]